MKGICLQSDSHTYLLDTNIILRFLLADDPAQTRSTTELMVKVGEGKVSVEIKDFVLLETVWVLEASCRVPRKEIADKLINILNLSGIVNASRSTLIQALLSFKETKMDLVDCLLAAYSSPTTPVISFDGDLKKLGALRGEINRSSFE
jgi:predicted nucleic-acid-binding protein